MTKLERELEQALLEYVERYGLTQKARAILTKLPDKHEEICLPEIKAASAKDQAFK